MPRRARAAPFVLVRELSRRTIVSFITNRRPKTMLAGVRRLRRRFRTRLPDPAAIGRRLRAVVRTTPAKPRVRVTPRAAAPKVEPLPGRQRRACALRWPRRGSVPVPIANIRMIKRIWTSSRRKRPMKRGPAAEVAEPVRRAPAAEVAEAPEAACRQEGLRMARCERSARAPLCGPTPGV